MYLSQLKARFYSFCCFPTSYINIVKLAKMVQYYCRTLFKQPSMTVGGECETLLFRDIFPLQYQRSLISSQKTNKRITVSNNRELIQYKISKELRNKLLYSTFQAYVFSLPHKNRFSHFATKSYSLQKLKANNKENSNMSYSKHCP